MVQRPFNFAIVDEVDSILIDEARTPLIISGPTDDKSELYMSVDKIVKGLDPADYEHRREADARSSSPRTAPRRWSGCSRMRGCWSARTSTISRTRWSSTTSTRRCARTSMFKRDTDYIVKEGKVDHHRRVHRPDDGGPALVGRPPPGGRGQGRGRDRAREPDPRLDHLPELFPPLSQARRHDRHRRDRGAPNSGTSTR